jgi:hypothetical protein
MRGDYRFSMRALNRGIKAVWSDDAGTYNCGHCGATWQTRVRHCWWPVRVRLVRRWSFGRHGVEVGFDGIEQRVVQQVWSLGPIRIVLGPDRLAEGGGGT